MTQPAPACTFVVVRMVCFSFQPLGSMPKPRPARIVVVVCMVFSSQPLGSMPTPAPARMVVVVVMGFSCGCDVKGRGSTAFLQV